MNLSFPQINRIPRFPQEWGCSYAYDALYVGMLTKKVNWIIDADIRGFFDTIDHGWLVKFIEHRIGDPRVVQLIRKWLNAGVMEQGRWRAVDEGTPQGGVILTCSQ